VRLAVRLKDTLANSWQEPRGGNGVLTASFGVDSFTGREDLTPKALLQQADRWLLLAKARGRNTVCHPDSPRFGPEIGLTREEYQALFPKEHPHTGRAGGSYG
jgi:hypothetical protein